MIKVLVIVCSALLFNSANAVVNVKIKSTSSSKSIGTIQFTDTPYGLLIQPQLKNLPAGVHGFHIHQNASCDDKGMAAGGHFDPANTGLHLGPYGQGHLGDLPVLYVDTDGNATLPLLAPRLKEQDLKEHSLMIHAGGDNYSDVPNKLGGGGARIACGVAK